MQRATRLQIVGGQRIVPSDGDMDEALDFYGGLFSRLTTEVKHTGSLTRYIGYQSPLGGKECLHFLGIEVETIEGIPAGMLAWDLNDSTWTVWEAGGGHDVVVSRENISWHWLAPSPAGDGRCTGEFTARLPVALAGQDQPALRDFWVSANAYVSLPESDASGDEVHLVDYDPSWPQKFQEFVAWLRDFLGSDVALRIEHYGSTAIPGMPAKPVIDVLVEIPSFAEAKKRVVPLLNSPTWGYWWYSGHMEFVKRDKLMGRRTHHVHLAPRGHKLWEGLVFRDYLRTHPEEASRYAALKHELAAHYAADRERYTQAKTKFVREIVSKASRQTL